MATVDGEKAQKILMYLLTNGFKATNINKTGVEGLGFDIIAFLNAEGHTVTGDAENRLKVAKGGGMKGNTYSDQVSTPWADNAPIVAETFGGLTAYDIDNWTINTFAKIGAGVQKVRDSNGIVFPQGASKGMGGRNAKPESGFNRTGWDLINILSIASTGSVDEGWVNEVRAGVTSGLAGNSKYELGSACRTFGATIPVRTPLGRAVPSATPPSTPSATPAPAPAPAPEPAPAEPAPPSEFDEYLETDDLSIWWKNGDEIELPEPSERMVSTKAWNANGGKIPYPTDARLSVKLGSTREGAFNLEIFAVLLSSGKLDYDVYEKIMANSDSNMETALDDDGGEYDVVQTPTVILSFYQGQAFIGIEGFGQVPATQGPNLFNYRDLKLVMDEPSAGGAITDVLVDGVSLREIVDAADGVYGFPFAGLEGLENRFKAGNYTDGGPGESAEEQASQALSAAYQTGYRKITHGPVEDIMADLSQLDETLLQPLALDFDTELDLDTQAAYFTLKFESTKDSTNLFTGFNINDSSDSNQEEFLFPFDIRNLRPINEDRQVMDPAKRRDGEGIASIKVASKDKGSFTLEVGSKEYSVDLYTQFQMTSDDGTTILVPDLDERFEALDNQGQTLRGIVATSESGRPAIMVITGALDIRDIEKHLTAARRSSRLSGRYNSINELTGQVDTKTIMIQQDNNYYIVVGAGSKTYALKIRGD